MATLATESYDARFGVYVDPAVQVERLWSGGRWLEGPVWMARDQALIWSDIPNNRMMRWTEAEGASEFRKPANGGNGNSTDMEGRLVTAEQYSRRITRTEFDGAVTVLGDRFEGKRFTAPNDVVVASDNAVWFTDPDYGKSPDYQGSKELDGCHVYRIDGDDGSVRQMTTDFIMPNGLAFSKDERLLYIIDTGSTHKFGGPNHIRRMTVGTDWILGGGEVIAVNDARCFDGMRVDGRGRLWCGVENGVICYERDGTPLGKILLPERASNLCFGGPERDQVLITASTSIYRYRLKISAGNVG